MLLLAALLYGIYTFVDINSFKSYVDSTHGKVFTLSRTEDFETYGEVLEVTGPSTMDNTTLAAGKSHVDEPPIEENLLEILTADGYNGPKDVSYICSTFYLKNITGEEQTYYEVVKINSATKNIEDAIRIMLVRNYEIEVYAKAKRTTDPETEEVTVTPEKVVPLRDNYKERKIVQVSEGIYELQIVDSDEAWMSKDFVNDDYAVYRQNTVAANETLKYTIIVWIEGWDSECDNERIGGIINMDFSFTGISFEEATAAE